MLITRRVTNKKELEEIDVSDLYNLTLGGNL